MTKLNLATTGRRKETILGSHVSCAGRSGERDKCASVARLEP